MSESREINTIYALRTSKHTYHWSPFLPEQLPSGVLIARALNHQTEGRAATVYAQVLRKLNPTLLGLLVLDLEDRQAMPSLVSKVKPEPYQQNELPPIYEEMMSRSWWYRAVFEYTTAKIFKQDFTLDQFVAQAEDS